MTVTAKREMSIDVRAASGPIEAGPGPRLSPDCRLVTFRNTLLPERQSGFDSLTSEEQRS
jgi:hypothetical protein